ncbi:MAG: hypothetical protein RBS85_05750 [Methanofastidiosum sp.]|jgi:hypothetical protein|nr:hypothetical protein [Methanofastidiosum sp.]
MSVLFGATTVLTNFLTTEIDSKRRVNILGYTVERALLDGQ